jgi:hypothetical protein
MKNLLQIILLLFIFGCSQKKEEKVIITKSKAYKQSEMAAYMLKMYAVSLENKQLILDGKSPRDFPKDFLKIHTARLTDSTDRDASFKVFSDFYLASFQRVFKTSKDSLKIKHNNAVNSCIACHKTTCIGPIPRIKKLLIQ